MKNRKGYSLPSNLLTKFPGTLCSIQNDLGTIWVSSVSHHLQKHSRKVQLPPQPQEKA